MSNPTDRQWNFLRTLLNERYADPEAAYDVLVSQRLTAKGASEVIEALLRMPKLAVAPITYNADVYEAGELGKSRGNLPYNRFSGTCVLCGNEVAAQCGTYRKGTTVRWETLHLPGECPTAVAEAPVASQGTFSDQVQEITANIPDGRFAVPSVTGSNDLTFFLVGTGRTSKRRYVRHIVGGHEDTGRLTLDWIRKAVSSVETLGAHDCMILFGQEIGSCGHCGRELTDEVSRAAGIGPVCAGKF